MAPVQLAEYRLQSAVANAIAIAIASAAQSIGKVNNWAAAMQKAGVEQPSSGDEQGAAGSCTKCLLQVAYNWVVRQ